MESPLLGGRKNGANSQVRNGRRDAITRGSVYEKAAALVDLAEDGAGLPEEILHPEALNFESAAKLYFYYTWFDFLWSLNYFALIILNFIEKPLWCASYGEGSCNQREYYFLGQLPYLTGTESLIFEVISFVILMVHVVYPISFEGSKIYWKKHLNILKVTLLSVLAVDILFYALYLSPVAFSSLPFRIAPYVRVIFFVLSIRELRGSVVVLAGMLPTYFNVMALASLFLLFASWIAYIMFEDTKQGQEVFTSFGATLYQMFVLFTTSNNPDVWIPAYKVSRWYSLFFVLYILLGVYFVTNLILAVVYDSFKEELVKQVVGKDIKRKSILLKAFDLLDTQNNVVLVVVTLLLAIDACLLVNADYITFLHLICKIVLASYYVSDGISYDKWTRKKKLGYLDQKQCIRLFEELNKYRTLPKISEEDFISIFEELDDSHDFKIDAKEFDALCHDIALKFSKEDCASIFEAYPSIYKSSYSLTLRDFVRGPTFGNIIAIILVINLITVIIETTLDVQDDSAQNTWQLVEFVFGWIYVIEMVLKVYAYGFVNYWRDGQNKFDFIITCVIVAGETLTFASADDGTFLSNGEWIRYLILARVLRLIRLLLHVKRYRAFVATFFTLLPSLMPYLGTIFCVMCIYSSLGVQIFGGIVNAGNPSLEGNELADNGYLLFNFNDYPNAMVTTFNLLVMGNWQAWMQAYMDLSNTAWALVYFISFYLITVMLILNLIIAFVLEAFFSELDNEESEEESEEAEEGKKEARTARRRHVGAKTQSQRVDALLHRLLKAELKEEEAEETMASTSNA